MRRSSRPRQGNITRRGMKAVACVLFSGSVLVGNIVPSVAEAPRLLTPAIPNSPAPSYAEPERSDNSVLWGIGLAAAGVIGCAILGCFGGDDEPVSSSSGSNYHRDDSSQSSGGEYQAAPDTSVGCFWGDEKYGTCH